MPVPVPAPVPEKVAAAGEQAVSDKNRRKSKHRRQNEPTLPLPLHSFFPLFRPAGESYPESVVPLEADVAARRMVQLLDPFTSPATRTREVAQARRTVLALFECVGVVLGFSIRNSCPMGLGACVLRCLSVWTVVR